MKKKDLIAGEHWVEIKSGELGCVMGNGIVFKESSIHTSNYNEDLTCKYERIYDIIRILEPKSERKVGYFGSKTDLNTIAEIKILETITSLNQLEEVCNEMCEKHGGSFYMTNESGEWEIRGKVTDILHKSIDFKKEGYELALGGVK